MNKIKIGEIIYKLRKGKNITQEQLGEFIGVSKGAISKWESGVSYPDIEMLPVLARFFEITIDELLNYDITVSEEIEEKICGECQKEIYEGNVDKALELCKGYIKKYTKNYKMKFTLATIMAMSCAYMKDEEKIKKIYGKVINVYEDIVNNSTDDEIVEGSRLQLSMYYASFDEYDKSLEVLDKMKKSICNVDVMKAKIYIRQGEIKKGRKLYQEGIMNSTMEFMAAIHGLASSYYKEDLELAEKYMRFSFEITDLLNGNNVSKHFSDYLQLSEFYAYHKDEEKCLNAIKEAVQCLQNREKQEMPWYLSELESNSEGPKSMRMNKAIVNFFEYDDTYKFLEDNNEFIKLKEEMRNLEI